VFCAGLYCSIACTRVRWMIQQFKTVILAAAVVVVVLVFADVVRCPLHLFREQDSIPTIYWTAVLRAQSVSVSHVADVCWSASAADAVCRQTCWFIWRTNCFHWPRLIFSLVLSWTLEHPYNWLVVATAQSI
jgi:hypothetical protein